MNNNNLKFVCFEHYCKQCKHENEPEEKDPCDMCLSLPAREGTNKPLCFEEKEKK